MEKGDRVQVQGVPGEIVGVSTRGADKCYLVLLETPTLRWLSQMDLTGPGEKGGPESAPELPTSPSPAVPARMPRPTAMIPASGGFPPG